MTDDEIPCAALQAFCENCGYLYLSGDAVDDLVDGLRAARPYLVDQALLREREACVREIKRLLEDAEHDQGSGFVKGLEASIAAITRRDR